MRPLHWPLAVFLICISAFATSSQPQQQRGDPSDVGTGPSSRAPGEMSYGSPKSPETTNARGDSSGASALHSKTIGETGSDRREDSKAKKEWPEE